MKSNSITVFMRTYVYTYKHDSGTAEQVCHRWLRFLQYFYCCCCYCCFSAPLFAMLCVGMCWLTCLLRLTFYDFLYAHICIHTKHMYVHIYESHRYVYRCWKLFFLENTAAEILIIVVARAELRDICAFMYICMLLRINMQI